MPNSFMNDSDRDGRTKKIAVKDFGDGTGRIGRAGASDVEMPDGMFATQISTTQRKSADNFSGGTYAAGAASKTALQSNWTFLRDTGGITITLTNGALTLGMGTTNGAELLMVHKDDATIPTNLMVTFALSQRIAGNEVRFGYLEVDSTGTPVANANVANFFNNMASMLFDGTTPTTSKLETLADGSTAKTVTIASMTTTGAAADYSMECRPEDVNHMSQVADSNAVRAPAAGRISTTVPNPNKRYRMFIWVRNVSAPASNTNLTVSRIISMDVQELQAEIGGGRGNATGAQAIPVVLAAAGTATPVAVSNMAHSAASNSNSYHRLQSAATTNATVVKAAAGRIVGGIILNTGASISYLKLYAKATAPVVGTDVPVFTIPLVPNVPVSIAALFDGYGLYIATGISYALTKNYADADTTAVGAGEVTVQLTYA